MTKSNIGLRLYIFWMGEPISLPLPFLSTSKKRKSKRGGEERVKLY
jgi:hypothetical protein